MRKKVNFVIAKIIYILLLFLLMESARYLSLNPFIDNISIVDEKRITPVVDYIDYDKSELYVPTTNDPQVIVSNIDGSSKSYKVCVEGAENLDVIEVFYSYDDAFNSRYSEIIYSISENVFLFELPTEDITSIRIDINTSFSKLDFFSSYTPLIMNYDKNYSIGVSTFFVFILSIIISFLCPFKYLISLFNDLKLFFTNKISIFRIVKFLAVITITVAISFLIEYMMFNSLVFNNFVFQRFYFILVTLLISLLLIIFRNEILGKCEFIVFIITILIGSLLIISIPSGPMVSWDDEIHYRNAVSVSYLGESRLTSADLTIINRSFPLEYNHVNISYQNEILDKKYDDGSILNDSGSFEFYRMVGYIPNATGLVIGRTLDIPYHYTFMLGKFINLLFYAIVVFFSMKNLKSGKMILGLISLFPTSIFLAVNYTYDAWIICLFMYSFSYIIGIIQDKSHKVSLKDSFLIFSSFVLGCLAKTIYFPMILIALLIPKDRFLSLSDKKKFNTVSIVVSVLLFLSFVLPFLFGSDSPADLRGGETVNSSEQLLFILKNPLEYAYILFNFSMDYLSLDSALNYISLLSYVGSISGGVLYLVLLFILIILDRDKNDYYYAKTFNLFFVFVLFIVTVFLVSTALYLSFTPVGLNTINGVQGRYLLPIIFPLFFVIGSTKIESKICKNKLYIFVLGLSVYVLLTGIWDLIVSFY